MFNDVIVEYYRDQKHNAMYVYIAFNRASPNEHITTKYITTSNNPAVK